MSHLRATQILAAIGLGCAIALAGMTRFTDPTFVLVTIAIAIGARHELGEARRLAVAQPATVTPGAGAQRHFAEACSASLFVASNER